MGTVLPVLNADELTNEAICNLYKKLGRFQVIGDAFCVAKKCEVSIIKLWVRNQAFFINNI